MWKTSLKALQSPVPWWALHCVLARECASHIQMMRIKIGCMLYSTFYGKSF